MRRKLSFRDEFARVCVRAALLAECDASARTAAFPETPYSLDSLPPDPLFQGEEYGGSTRDKHNGYFEDFCKTGPAPSALDERVSHKVCIVGAGVSGLYIAIILDSLAIPGLTYEIVEASSRVGGRIYTHHFSNDKHDYYDIGAMRFPDIPAMQRAFHLFRQTKMPLVPYYMDGGDNCPKHFNGKLFKRDMTDPYRVSQANGGSVPDSVVAQCGELLAQENAHYSRQLKEDIKRGIQQVLEADDLSARQYLCQGGPDGSRPKYDFFSTQWMETQTTFTESFSHAASALIFSSPTLTNDPWWCIDGGTTLLTDAMQEMMQNKVEINKCVKAITIDRESSAACNMAVHIQGENQPRTGFSTVFNTTTLAALGRMDLETLRLHPSQRDAIRSVHYEDSTKVAVKFKYPWWIVHCGITRGGMSRTDLPLRRCVYPSYNIHDEPDKPAVLLASYTTGQDARRMGSLINSSAPDEELLIDLILRDLATLHSEHMTYDMMKDAYAGVYHAFAWGNDPYAAGAFANFDPSQFRHFYPYLTRPAAQAKFHIVGEAASAHQTWLSGSLDSAYSAVYKFLRLYEMKDAIEALEKRWGHVDELETGYGGTAHLQVQLGKLAAE